MHTVKQRNARRGYAVARLTNAIQSIGWAEWHCPKLAPSDRRLARKLDQLAADAYRLKEQLQRSFE